MLPERLVMSVFHRNRKRLIKDAIAFLIILLVFGSLFVFLFRTSSGSAFITKLALSLFMQSRKVKVENVEGDLRDTVTYKNIEIRDVPWLPSGTHLKIQELVISLDSWALDGLRVSVQNGRLFLTDTDVILFYGDFRDKAFAMQAYSKYVNVRAILSLFRPSASIKNIKGSVEDFDVKVTGTLFEPRFDGSCLVKVLRREGFYLKESPVTVGLTLKNIRKDIRLVGDVAFAGGDVAGPQTAVVHLYPSRIMFNGDPFDPEAHVKGHSKVAGVRISVSVTGLLRQPQLAFTSDPPMAETRLAIMLATGRAWGGAEDAANNGKMSPELAGDFIDYFVFGGRERSSAVSGGSESIPWS